MKNKIKRILILFGFGFALGFCFDMATLAYGEVRYPFGWALFTGLSASLLEGASRK